MNRKYSLHAFTLNNTSHGKSFFETTAVSCNSHDAKTLNTFFVPLNNLYRYVHLIANGKLRCCFFHLFFFNHINNIHTPYLLFLIYQVIPMHSPLIKGDSGGCVFPWLFYNPLAPFSKGDSLCHTSHNPLK